MNPLVKWTGGKRGEIPYLKPHYPSSFSRVIEPFAGGAAVAWDLDGVPAVINDVNKGLVAFYRGLQDPVERAHALQALQAIADRRASIRSTLSGMSDDEVRAFFDEPSAWLVRHLTALTGASVDAALDTRFHLLMAKHAASKTRRVAKIQAGREEVFTPGEMRDHVETAIQSAWYEVLRDVYNGVQVAGKGWLLAAWWSVRVLCYSGMFRFSRKGLFNVPYGGISYNARDFRQGLDEIFGAKRVAELARFTIESVDFDALFKAYNDFSADDFVFVDPPYDSTFSQYNVEGDFGAADQTRLRDALERCKARWMLVIKRTDFIEKLYAGRGNHCHIFDKTYMVNFRNRHDRGVQHLVVTNYPLTLSDKDALRPLESAAENGSVRSP